MTSPRHSAPVLSRRSRLALCCALLLVSALLGAAAARAAEDTALDAAQLAALAEQQRIDLATGAFDSPLLIRLRARVSPNWPGPRGAAPVTERRNCPVIRTGAGDFVPAFC